MEKDKKDTSNDARGQAVDLDVDGFFPTKRTIAASDTDEETETKDVETQDDDAEDTDDDSDTGRDAGDSEKDSGRQEDDDDSDDDKDLDDDDDDLDEDDIIEGKDKGKKAKEDDSSRQIISDLTSQLQRSLASQQTQADQIKQLTDALASKTEEEDEPDIFAGKADDDYPTIGELREFQKNLAKSRKKAIKAEPEKRVDPKASRDESWVMSQPDFNEVDSFARKNAAALNADPRIQVAAGNLITTYFAVRNIMDERKLRETRKKEKQRKKFKEEQRRRGKNPNTETAARRKESARPAGKRDPIDDYFTSLPGNRVINR